MDKQRKITVAILAMLVVLSILSIVQISMRMEEEKAVPISLGKLKFGPGIAIVRVDGPIQMLGDSTPLGVVGGAESLVNRLDELGKNSKIKGIVVRINSPGGTVAATQEIYEKLMELRKKGIVLVASMGEIAASGGYYIAAACNYIIANFGTITGSIGVIAVSPDIQGLFKKLGIKMNVIKSGKYKDILSSYRDLSVHEREMLQEMIDSSYMKFVKDIARGRDMEKEEILKVADGRIFNGPGALKYKLIDELGTFSFAIKKTLELCKLPEDAPVYRKEVMPLQKILEGISTMFNGASFIKGALNENSGKLEYRYVP